MRRAMTPAEKALWFALGQRRLDGAHFRRQALIGPFVVDLVAHSAMLIVDVDGEARRGSDLALRESERTRWLEGRGYKVMRFSNARVLNEAAAIAEEIAVQARARMRVIAMMCDDDPFEAHAS